MHISVKVILIIGFLGFSIMCRSQQRYDYSSVAGYNIPVFRGELAEKYNFPLEGTVYAYSDDFEIGDLEFNGKRYYGLTMNLNVHRNELQVQIGNSGENMALKRELVGDFSIGNRNFTALYGARKIKGLAEGYYQVLYRGKDMLLKQIYKRANDRSDFITGTITKVFATRIKYWLIMEGIPVGVKDVNDLAGIYSNRKDAVKKYIKGHKDGDRDYIFTNLMSIIEQPRQL